MTEGRTERIREHLLALDEALERLDAKSSEDRTIAELKFTAVQTRIALLPPKPAEDGTD